MKFVVFSLMLMVAMLTMAAGFTIITPSFTDTGISLYPKSTTDFRVLFDLGDNNYLVEVNVNTRVENVTRPGKYMQIKVPHLVKLNVEQIKRLNDRR